MTPASRAIAADVLAGSGISSIWYLYTMAAGAHEAGRCWAANTLLEVADAAEEIVREGGFEPVFGG